MNELPDKAGLEGLEKAMRFRLYANLNDEEYIIDGNSMIYRTLNCRVQRARSRKGMEWHPFQYDTCEYCGIALI